MVFIIYKMINKNFKNLELQKVVEISQKYGCGLNFALAGTGARDQLAGKVKVSK